MQKGGGNIKDLIEMSYAASQVTENKEEQQELFATMVLEEIKKMQGTEFASHFACIFDTDKFEYRIILTFPAELAEPYKERIKKFMEDKKNAS